MDKLSRSEEFDIKNMVEVGVYQHGYNTDSSLYYEETLYLRNDGVFFLYHMGYPHCPLINTSDLVEKPFKISKEQAIMWIGNFLEEYAI